MCRRIFSVIFLSLLFFGWGQSHATTDLNGQWYGAGWDFDNEFQTTNVDLVITESGGSGVAVLHVPDFGVFHQSLPLNVVGTNITIGDPSVFGLTGTIIGNSIEGEAWQSSLQVATWYVAKEMLVPPFPGQAPGQMCDDLPPLMCDPVGFDNCYEWIPFEPVEGPGYFNYPVPGETWEDQRYSFARRDLVYLVKYATAKVACKTTDWGYGNFAPLGLGDMSQADGATPGTDIGSLRHPPGTHTLGLDIDMAYYQTYCPDNLMRPVGETYIGNEHQLHLVTDPVTLDRWRTALFVAYLSEHPHLRVIGVDGRIGPVLEETLDELVTLGWIDSELRFGIPLAYEVEDGGLGWYLFHFGHMHVSMIADVSDVPVLDEIPSIARLLDCFPNPFNPQTTIAFVMARKSNVDLHIFDMSGRLVKGLANGETLGPGRQEIVWNGRDESGLKVASGMYFYRLEVGQYSETKRLVLIK